MLLIVFFSFIRHQQVCLARVLPFTLFSPYVFTLTHFQEMLTKPARPNLNGFIQPAISRHPAPPCTTALSPSLYTNSKIHQKHFLVVSLKT